METPESILSSGVLLVQGDAGTGKSTICEWIVPALSAAFYDTSNMWRGMTAYGLLKGLDWGNPMSCQELAAIYAYELIEGRSIVCGVDITDDLRSEETTAAVSQYASVSILRSTYTVAALEWIQERPAVASGRHMREVFPEAPLCVHIVRDFEESKLMREGQSDDNNSHLIQSRRELDAKNATVAGVDEKDATIVDVTGMSRLRQAEEVLVLAEKSGFGVDWNRFRQDHPIEFEIA